MFLSDTIAAISTGMTNSGIGIIRISGSEAFDVADRIFQPCKGTKKVSEMKSHTVHYGKIVSKGIVIDEVLLTVMKAPNTYTKENIVEINCHGGVVVVNKIMEIVLENGARPAEPGEYTKRAFLNGRIDLSQAEAVIDVINAKNEYALSNSVNQLQGRISEKIVSLRTEIMHNIAYIEAALDDPEHYELGDFSEQLYQNIQNEIETLQDLLDNFENGRMKSEGINTVIVGKPNAGKSSLMNLLLDEERAIVTNIAGTTRDILEETVQIGNLTLNLIDTAGIHDTEDIVESLGVEKAMEYLSQADFIIYVVDMSDVLDESDEKIIELLQHKNGVILLNKSDLKGRLTEQEIRDKLDWNCISFSSKTGDGLQILEEYITNSFLDGTISYNDQIYLTSVRHREAVEDALQSLKQVLQTIDDGMPEDLYMVDLMDAYRKLGLINGETASEDLVNKIFKEFCMGK